MQISLARVKIGTLELGRFCVKIVPGRITGSCSSATHS